MQVVIAVLIAAVTAVFIIHIYGYLPEHDYDYPAWVHRIAVAIRSHWRAHA